jgi:hypothetical protein
VPVVGLFADIATHTSAGAIIWKSWVQSELSIQFQRVDIDGQRSIDGSVRFRSSLRVAVRVTAQLAIQGRGRRRETLGRSAHRRMVMSAKAGSLYGSGFSGWCALEYIALGNIMESDGDILSVVRDADSLHFR